jgi:copper oxidase (laccase) domain-containing protein
MDNVFYAISGVSDGSMSKAVDDERRRANRQSFLQSKGVTLEQSVLVHLKYEGDDYCRYSEVTSEYAGDGMAIDSSIVADALFTKTENLALFLPVADCVGAVLYDQTNHVLGLAHFGRHNLLQQGGANVVKFMNEKFGSHPGNIQVWLSPAAGSESYPMHDFNNRGLVEVAVEQLIEAGVPVGDIEIDGRDTTKDQSFFSHSEFLRGNREIDGRQAVVAMMRT